MSEEENVVIEKFDKLNANMGENFADYLVMVRLPNGGHAWKASDKNWALGAIKRFVTCIEEKDRFDVRKQEGTNE